MKNADTPATPPRVHGPHLMVLLLGMAVLPMVFVGWIALAEYGEVYGLREDEFDAQVPEDLKPRISLRYPVAKLTAWAAVHRERSALAERAWEMLLWGDGFSAARDRPVRPAQ